LENGFVGAVTMDDRLVYRLDDLSALPPPQWPVTKDNWGEIVRELKDAFHESALGAFQRSTGKLIWSRNGVVILKDAFAASHFLGLPLPQGGKLYVLNETNRGELRLAVLDPATGNDVAKVNLDLVPADARFLVDYRRRLNPVHLAAAEGILICPTQAGKLFGVDLKDLRVLWTHTYRRLPPAPQAVLQTHFRAAEWKASRPFIHAGKVVFTAADDPSVHCVDLRSGKALWKAQRKNDLYLAGIGGDKVLLVGKEACRALALKDGQELWQVETGVPAGLGAFAGNLYMLPVNRAPRTGHPEVSVLDLAQGRVARRHPTPGKERLGNLILHPEYYLVQTSTALIAFPREKGP
jgi:outer membrane protein assembly factor BamB